MLVVHEYILRLSTSKVKVLVIFQLFLRRLVSTNSHKIVRKAQFH